MFEHAADVREGNFGRDVEAAVVQLPDFIMFHRIHALGIDISDWQGEIACVGRAGNKSHTESQMLNCEGILWENSLVPLDVSLSLIR